MGKTEEAFLMSEKLQARSYLDLLNRSQPPVRDQKQRGRETILRNRIRELQRKIEEEAGKTPPERRGEAVDLYSKELAVAEREYEDFLDDLISTDPNYTGSLKLRTPTSEEVQRQLATDTALIEYVIAEDSLEIFFVTAKELRAKSVSIRAVDLQNKVEFLRD